MHSLLSTTTFLRVCCALLWGAFAILANGAEPASTVTKEDWKLVSSSNDVSIYSRTHAGSTLKEFKAVGKVNAAPRSVLAVLDDVEAYSSFMPYMAECRILKREDNCLISYQRIAPPFCTDRDYSIRVRHEVKNTPDGPAYVCRWELANSLGPAEHTDVLRVKINEGSWLIEPQAGGVEARATYYVYTDSGGALPAWLSVKANQIAIGKLYEAIRKQVKNSKYTAAH